MTTLNKPTVKRMLVDIDNALAVIARQYGLKSITVAKARLTGTTVTMRVEALTFDGLSREAIKYNRYRSSLNLPVLNTSFVFKGDTYTTQGLNRTNTKVLVQDTVTAGRYWRRVQTVVDCMNGNITFAPSRRKIGGRSRRGARAAATRAARPAPTALPPFPTMQVKQPMGFALHPKEPALHAKGTFAIDLKDLSSQT